MRTISVINLKGGVGKTVTSTNLAYQLARRGNNVLLIDCDKQGNSSKTFNVYDYEPNLADVLLSEVLPADKLPQRTDIKSAIYNVFENETGKLDIIPADLYLLKAKQEILKFKERPQPTILIDILKTVEKEYTYCIIDCAPDMDEIVCNALTASNEYIIPVTIDSYACEGINTVNRKIAEIRELYNPTLKLSGYLITKYVNNSFTNDRIEILKERYGKVFDSKIKRTDKVSESTFEGKTVIEYSPRCGASRSYAQLAAEIERGQNNNG